MIISKLVGTMYFQTDFNDEYYIVHAFTNLDGGALVRNNPIEFSFSGLTSKSNPNRWNPEIKLSVSSDEAAPAEVNYAFIGGNHGQPCGILIYSPLHGKTIADVGAVYKDSDDTRFTLLRVLNEDYLIVVSDNVGESDTNYKFVLEAKSNLKYVENGKDVSDVVIVEQISRYQIYKAIRHHQRKTVAYFKDGSKKTVETSAECEYAEIIEEYDIINPATVAPALRKARPEGGFTYTPDLKDFGTPMLNHKMIYRVMPDGTMIMEFELTKLQDVIFNRFMGVMYQEKIDVFGGGIYRCLPKTKPFDTAEGHFDFSSPYPLRGGAYPNHYFPTKEQWDNPDSPPERIVDYFRDKDGKDKLGFSCGYLPVYDGVGEVRKNNYSSIMIYKTRKAYPTFLDGNMTHFKGVAYKKFFDTLNRRSIYSVPYEGKKYLYFDTFSKNTATIPVSGKVSLYEKSDDVTYSIENGNLTVSGNKGFAVFIEE